jgi:hypothetical protein
MICIIYIGILTKISRDSFRIELLLAERSWWKEVKVLSILSMASILGQAFRAASSQLLLCVILWQKLMSGETPFVLPWW